MTSVKYNCSVTIRSIYRSTPVPAIINKLEVLKSSQFLTGAAAAVTSCSPALPGFSSQTERRSVVLCNLKQGELGEAKTDKF